MWQMWQQTTDQYQEPWSEPESTFWKYQIWAQGKKLDENAQMGGEQQQVLYRKGKPKKSLTMSTVNIQSLNNQLQGWFN